MQVLNGIKNKNCLTRSERKTGFETDHYTYFISVDTFICWMESKELSKCLTRSERKTGVETDHYIYFLFLWTLLYEKWKNCHGMQQVAWKTMWYIDKNFYCWWLDGTIISIHTMTNSSGWMMKDWWKKNKKIRKDQKKKVEKNGKNS